MGGTCRNANNDLKPKPTSAPFWMSDRSMYWWSAKNFCQALGKNLVEVSDLQCAHSICPSGCAGIWGYCHKDDSLGLLVSDGVNISTPVTNMKTAYGEVWGWLNTTYTNCMAYNVNFKDGTTDRHNRKGTNPAVCKNY